MNKPFIAENTHILLRPMTEADCPDIVRWRNEDRIRIRYIYRERFTEEAERIYFHREVETGRVIHLMIAEKNDPGRSVGCYVISGIDPESGEGESGLFLGEEDVLGRGIGVETLRAGADWAFGSKGFTHLTARVFTDNLPSLKTHENAGYRTVRILKNVECTDGEIKDMYLMERDREGNGSRT